MVSPDRRSVAYAAVLRELAPAYGALEAGLVLHADHPIVAPFHRPDLFRLAAVRSDLARLGGLDEPPRSYAALALARRILEHSADRPEGLVGHVFALFALDLSLARIGGPWIGRGMRERGLAALRFDRVPDLKAAREELDAYFDAVPRRAISYVEREAELAVALRAELTRAVVGPALRGVSLSLPPAVDASPLLDTLRRSLLVGQR